MNLRLLLFISMILILVEAYNHDVKKEGIPDSDRDTFMRIVINITDNAIARTK
jgi:hypothetical protein